jgi:hypothetical protein
MEPPSWPLGDVDNVPAYVAAVVRNIARGLASRGIQLHDDERDELCGEGRVYANVKWAELAPDGSLQRALAAGLADYLRNVYWRQWHHEWRRNTRAGTSYSLGARPGSRTSTMANRHRRSVSATIRRGSSSAGSRYK